MYHCPGRRTDGRQWRVFPSFFSSSSFSLFEDTHTGEGRPRGPPREAGLRVRGVWYLMTTGADSCLLLPHRTLSLGKFFFWCFFLFFFLFFLCHFLLLFLAGGGWPTTACEVKRAGRWAREKTDRRRNTAPGLGVARTALSAAEGRGHARVCCRSDGPPSSPHGPGSVMSAPLGEDVGEGGCWRSWYLFVKQALPGPSGVTSEAGRRRDPVRARWFPAVPGVEHRLGK